MYTLLPLLYLLQPYRGSNVLGRSSESIRLVVFVHTGGGESHTTNYQLLQKRVPNKKLDGECEYDVGEYQSPVRNHFDRD